ncbi:MAG: efflux RND transporter permease subunit [Pirellulales bacterium]
MFNQIIAFSLKNRALVVAVTLILIGWGGYLAGKLPVDVFPDLNRPTVTVMTEAPGLAPEEVEALVTFPLESMLNGATDVVRVRSASGIGLSVVWVEFEWGTDIKDDRQIVAERLPLAQEPMPEGVSPVMAPISSIMGEIMLIGLQSKDGGTSPMELRTIADGVMRPRLLSIGGISQVTVMGGELRQYQVLTSPSRLTQYDVTLPELTEAVRKSNVATGGGFILDQYNESLIRITGRSIRLADIENTVVEWREPAPVLVKHVADVRYGGPVQRGTGSVGAEPAVILAIQKQPGASTLALDAAVNETLGVIVAELHREHPDVIVQREIFKQADFIETAIHNVQEAIRDGVLWLGIVLFIFLWNLRTGIITLLVLPLPIVMLALIFGYFGLSINTMTLGGIAIAIGDLVDDSIIDIENIFRRLKENRQRGRPLHPLRVVFLASSEVRNSIVYATLIVCLVVLPLFFLSGLEGRMFTPMGISYILTLMASLVVSLTITPVLASYLLPKAKFLQHEKDSFVVRWLKAVDRRVLNWTLRHPMKILVGALVLIAVSLSTIPFMGGEFLPPFNEGTFTINVITPPGTSLEESNRVGTLAEKMLMEIEEVTHVSRRTGRAELDEHAENVSYSEIDVGVREPHEPKAGWWNAVLRAIPGLQRYGVETVGRERGEVLADIRDRLTAIPGVTLNIGQPISHRLDHIMSGIRAQVAVKISGPDLTVLRAKAAEVQDVMQRVEGVVDLAIEPQVEIRQLRVEVNHAEAARHGLTPGDIAEVLETALRGRVVSQVLDQQLTFDLVVWFDEESRNNIEIIQSTLLDTPSGAKVTLGQVADVLDTTGPNTINREDVQRRIVVQCNVAGRDLVSTVDDIRDAVAASVTLPHDYFVEYGGQFEAQGQANRRLLLLVPVVLVGIFLLLSKALGSWRASVQVMATLPLAFIGSVIALLITNVPSHEALAQAPLWQWPVVWFQATSLSVAHWVGFITLTGIVTRNGIMMISHYIHLMKYEGEKFDEKMIIRGSLERLSPVMMTAVTSIIGLLPLLGGAEETGKEILYPLAVVVVGGMISSTLLDQIVTPALFYKFGRKVYEHRFDQEETVNEATLADRFGLPRERSDGKPGRHEMDGEELRAKV